MSKSARSGLSTVRRDWEDRPPSSPEVFYAWEPTQRPAPAQQQMTRGTSMTGGLTGAEKRLRDIQEAFAQISREQSLHSESSSQNKRPSPSDAPATAPPEKRRRLPSSWDDSLSASSLSVQSRSSNSKSGSVSSQTTPAPPESKNLASIFLSQEQTRILKLVQGGESVFFTGSAGMFVYFY